jgi:hypothetical protein
MKKLSVQTLVALTAGVILLLGGPLTASAASVDLLSGTYPFGPLATGDGFPPVTTYHVDGDLIMENGAVITCNDTPGPNACPITIEVTGNMIMKAGSAILAENNAGGGNGGDITITVGKNLTLCGKATPPPEAPGCDAAGPPGAVISSSKTSASGDTGHAGAITITVLGDKVIQEPGSIIKANGTGPAGEIKITGPKDIDINGSVLSQGGPGTGGLGGPISIVAKCNLAITDGGVVSSKGRDPGANLVHLQAGCDVKVYGLVESTGPGHAAPTSACHPTGKPANSTACVEVWAGQDIVIDSTGTHKGELNADTATSGGTNGGGWIDVFARRDISIIDGTGNDHLVATTGGNVPSLYAVHANQYLGNGHGGLVEVRAEKGKVSTSGNAIQANDTAAGGQGGKVDVEAGGLGAAGDVSFGTASIQAKGSTGGGAPKGGTIFAQSFHGSVTGTAAVGSELNAGGGPPVGTVTLTACIGNPFTTYDGTVTGTEFDNAGVCSLSDTPVIPVLPFCTGDCGCPTT